MKIQQHSFDISLVKAFNAWKFQEDTTIEILEIARHNSRKQ